MKSVKLENVGSYQAPGHFAMTAHRLHGKDETGAEKFWMGMSHFLPGGGAEYAYEDSPSEKIYFVLDGEVVVRSKTETHVLKKWDSILIKPFEGRELINETNLPATMLVIVNY